MLWGAIARAVRSPSPLDTDVVERVGVSGDTVEQDDRRPARRCLAGLHHVQPQSVDCDEQIALRELGAHQRPRHQQCRDK